MEGAREGRSEGGTEGKVDKRERGERERAEGRGEQIITLTLTASA